MSTLNGFVEYVPDRLKPMVVAHRGASGEAPENTLASFSLALDQGADAVEFDIHQTSDGKLIVMHDESLERTTNGSGMILQKTFSELKELDAGLWYSQKYKGERIPSLEDAIGFIAPRGFALVEVKHGSDIYPEIENNIATLMSSLSDHKRRTVFISFDPFILTKLREIDPELSTGLLTADPPDEYMDVAQESRIQCFLPRWERLKKESVQILHEHGYSVHPWVMDRKEDVEKVLSMRPDSISSNHPGMLSKLIGSRP